jgi:hypothetical protein
MSRSTSLDFVKIDNPLGVYIIDMIAPLALFLNYSIHKINTPHDFWNTHTPYTVRLSARP